MKIDGGISFVLDNAAHSAREAEQAGYSGAFTAETSHDPFLPLTIAAEHTEKLELGTSIAVVPRLVPRILYPLQTQAALCSS